MIWDTSLVHSGQLSWLFSFLVHPHLLAPRAALVAETSLTVHKHYFVVTKASVCHQYCFYPKSNTVSYQPLWRKLSPFKPKHQHLIFVFLALSLANFTTFLRILFLSPWVLGGKILIGSWFISLPYPLIMFPNKLAYLLPHFSFLKYKKHPLNKTYPFPFFRCLLQPHQRYLQKNLGLRQDWDHITSTPHYAHPWHPSAILFSFFPFVLCYYPKTHHALHLHYIQILLYEQNWGFVFGISGKLAGSEHI